MAVVSMTLLLACSLVLAAPADLKVTPGEFLVDHPTLVNLGFEWVVDGDANRNASVEVSYRKQGDADWKRGLPLLRLHGERIYQENSWNLVSPNMFAGSILDLQPNTAYEARFIMTDPDGVSGRAANATKTVAVRTRPEPMAAAGGNVYHVYPADHRGEKSSPAFEGIMCAYYYTCGGGDTTTTARPRVKAGDTILVHAGHYAYHPEFYGPDRSLNVTSPYEGTYYLSASGTAEKPIAIKAAGDGDVVLDGRGNFALFNVMAANYNYFEGLTFRNTDIAIWAGRQFIAGAKGLSVKRCRFEDVGMGVFSNYSGSADFYIADSTFLGRDDAERLLGWNGDFWRQVARASGQNFPPTLASYAAVKIYGPGHVVAHNYIANFHDGIDIETYGNPDGSDAMTGPAYPPRQFWDRRPVAIDFYNNYLTNFHDNAIEIDGSLHNIRVMRNMMLNSASHPMCNQPAGGGPVYWIRNIVYHAPAGSTRMTSGAAGVLFYNNTILTETSAGSSANAHWRNNLMLGENAATAIFSVSTNTNYSSSDYNGFRPNAGAATSFQWNSPPASVAADYGPVPSAAARGAATTAGSEGDGANRSLENRRFAAFGEYVSATRQDSHSLLVDYDIFVNVPRLDAKDLQAVQRLYKAEDVDFRLKPGSAAVDRGAALPNITDGFSGQAPDLGALELGQPLPIYGPRPVAR
ncbi:MAG: hypothetical protein ABMA15_04930 [Vicinamibacterales bacterium]